MLFEPTTLAATSSAIADAVEHYGCDAQSLFEKAELDFTAIRQPGARYPTRSMSKLWQVIREETDDPAIGVLVGQKMRPSALHALGLAWISSPTLLNGLRRIRRYAHVANTILQFDVIDSTDPISLIIDQRESEVRLMPEAIDAAMSVVVTTCRSMSGANFAPLLVTLRQPDNGRIDRYIEFFQAPIQFAAKQNALYFDAQTMRESLPAGNAELARANDRIAEQYLVALNPDLLQDKVRKILLTLLPSGEVSQELVAARLNRSVTTLRRQLRAEGVSYSQILEETKAALAQRLVRERRYSLSQVAYLLGFSDQANFSRAFKRWTGNTPKGYRERARL